MRLLLLLWLLVLPAAAQEKTFTHPEIGFSFQHPEELTVKEMSKKDPSRPSPYLFRHPKGWELKLNAIPYPSDMGPKTYLDRIWKGITSRRPGFESQPSQPLKLGEKEFWAIDYQEGLDLKGRGYFWPIPDDKRGLLFTVETRADDLAQAQAYFEAVLATVKVTER